MKQIGTMKQEDKDLLLRDLCARLPYGVKVQYQVGSQLPDIKIFNGKQYDELRIESYLDDWSKCTFKPYLFPLSSMTEEQKVEFDKMSELDIEYTITLIENNSQIWTSGLNRFNWFLKNHFDVYGLIPMDLAIDATNLNIY